MGLLLAGLVLFLGTHSVRIVADDWRSRRIAQLGQTRWKGLYSLVSLAGFVMLIWGYARARHDPIVLWAAPLWTRHLAALLTLPAFVLVAAAYVPGNAIKARLRHPMVLGVKLWALAHLIANSTLADVLLFGGFLVWAVFSFRAARDRDRVAGRGDAHREGTARGTIIAIAAGVVAWALLGFWAHGWLIGVRPFG